MKKSKIYALCAVIIIIDQVVKLLVTNNMELMQEIVVIPNFFTLFYVENTGAAFGMFEGAILPFIIVGLGVFFYIARLVDKTKKINLLNGIAFGLLMGGIVGNLIDRILYKAVVDYLQFIIGGNRFAVFNIADIAIVVGVSLLVIEMIKETIDNIKKKKKLKYKST